MRWGLLLGGLALVVLAVLAWQQFETADEAQFPRSLPILVDLQPARDEAVIPATSTTDAAVDDAGLDDAGTTAREISVEVFEAEGERHAAGVAVRFYLPPPDERAWRTLVASGTTNIMGWARVSLPIGEYIVEPSAEPAHAQIFENTLAITLRLRKPPPERVLDILVVDEQGQPVAGAQLEVRRSDASASSDAAFKDQLRKWQLARMRGEEQFIFARRVSGSTKTDATGHARLTSQAAQTVEVSARTDDKTSLWEPADFPGQLELHLTRGLATVRFTTTHVANEPVFIEYDLGPETRHVTLDPTRNPVAFMPGHLFLRAQALHLGRLFKGQLELDLAPDIHARATLELEPTDGLRVHVADEWGHEVGLAPVHADTDGGLMVGLSDESGNVTLLPDALRSYAPVYRLTTSAGWRNTNDAYARLGDAPVTFTVRAFNAAVDSTDAGNPVAWGGDR